MANFDDLLGDTWTPLIKSRNGGASWIPLYGPPFAALAIDLHDQDTLYAGTFDFPYFGYDGWDTRNGVLKSTDGGVSWNTTGLTDTGVNALAIDPINQASFMQRRVASAATPVVPIAFEVCSRAPTAAKPGFRSTMTWPT